MLFKNITLLDIFRKDGNENLSWAIIGVIMVFLFIPYGIYTNVRPYALLVVLYSFIMTLLKKPGAPFVVMAMALCLPQFSYSGDGFFFQEIISDKTQWIFISIRLSVVLNAIYNIVVGRKLFPFAGVVLLTGLFGLILCLYGTIINSIWKLINQLIYVHLFFAWCYYDRISLESVCKITSVIFICIFTYAVLQFNFDITPYIDWYLNARVENNHVHASGICGNALIFAAVVLCYHAVVLLRFLKEDTISIVLLLMILYAALISLERTAILVIVIEWLFFLVLRNNKMRENITMMLVVGIILIIAISIPYLNSTIDILSDRFEQGSGHRFAAYPMVFAAVSDNIYGVGESGVGQAMQWYGSGDLLKWFGTLDNFYLTQVLCYGVFCFFPIAFYLYYFIKALFLRKKNTTLFNSVVLCFLPWFLIGFSFNINAYIQLSLWCFGILGYIFSIYYDQVNHNNDKCIIIR